MATYKNYLKRADGTPILGAQACLYNTNNQRLDVDITEENGLYYFLNVSTGHYQVRFFGKDLTEDDWLEIDVVDSIVAGQDEIVFLTNPTLSVIEAEPKITSMGPSTAANFVVNNITTTVGTLAEVTLFYKLSSDDVEWKTLRNIKVDSNSQDVDQNVTLISGYINLELYDIPTIYNFKAQFFNPLGKIAKLNNVVIEPTCTTTFYGFTNVSEYVGVSGLLETNTKYYSDGGYYTTPADTLTITWADMKKVTPGVYNDTFGNPVTISSEQLKGIDAYVIMIYISKYGGSSSHYYPSPSVDDNGEWFYYGTVINNSAEIRIPKNKFIKVWVGFKNPNTNTTSTLNVRATKY